MDSADPMVLPAQSREWFLANMSRSLELSAHAVPSAC